MPTNLVRLSFSLRMLPLLPKRTLKLCLFQVATLDSNDNLKLYFRLLILLFFAVFEIFNMLKKHYNCLPTMLSKYSLTQLIVFKDTKIKLM